MPVATKAVANSANFIVIGGSPWASSLPTFIQDRPLGFVPWCESVLMRRPATDEAIGSIARDMT